MEENQKRSIDERIALLTKEEREAYDSYIMSGKPGLAASTNTEFFGLYLQGHTCQEFARDNPGFSLGLIVKARIDYNWDQEREKYIKDLMNSMQVRVQKTTLDAISFVSDGISVFHKLAGENFKRFLKTNDPKVLGDWKNTSFKTYKDYIDLLYKLTGRETIVKKESEAAGSGEDKTESPKEGSEDIGLGDAASFLKMLAGGKDSNG